MGHGHPADTEMPEQINYSSPSPFPLVLCEDVLQSVLPLHLHFSSEV